MIPNSPQNGNLLAAALDYHHHHGMSIIPTIDKRAAVAWRRYQNHPADEPELRRLMSRPGITGIAVVLGTVSHGLACRDYDAPDAYDRWAGAHPDLASTLPTSATSRGFHVYHRTEQERYVKQPDGEYIGDSKHYVLLPPSRRRDDLLYRWIIPLANDIPVVDPVSAGLLPLTHSEHTQSDTTDTQSDTTETTQIKAQTRLTEYYRPSNPSYPLHMSDMLAGANEATLPTGPGQRNRRLFDLARRLKAIMPGASPSELEPIVRQWHTAALPVIRTKDWIESWVDFQTAWAAVKRPFGATMAEIVEAAKTQTPAGADAIAKLTALCRTLQEHHGPGRAWPLSCRTAARIIGVGHDTAARILKLLCREGTIELVTPAGPRECRRAGEYLYLQRPQ
jgi:hypothetical protein